jgi:ribosomal protein S18 acetylase RimI-like enzyme
LKIRAEIEVDVVHEATDELAEAFARLIPQLSKTANPPDRRALAEIITAPCNTLLVARDRSKGGRIIGTLTLAIFRIPTGMRAWIEDVVVDADARGGGAGAALTLEAMRIAKLKGARTIDLTSRASRVAAHRLYESAGFAIRETNVYRYTSPKDDT